MILAIDARLMLGHPRGMGQYARMLAQPVKQQARLLVPSGQAGLLADANGLAKGHALDPWWEQVCLPQLAREVRATHLLCPSNTGPIQRLPGCAKILVVHDLIYMLGAQDLPWSRSVYQNLGRIYRRVVVPHALKSADWVVTVSNHTRVQLTEQLGVPRPRIRLVPNTVSEDWFVDAPLPDAEREGHLLCVAGEAPSKNLPRLLQAFGHVARRLGSAPRLRLVLVGVSRAQQPHFAALAAQAGVGQAALVFLNDLPAATLRHLYRTAWGCVVPSLYEGFGIPALEAMASGTPLACSDATALPEVTGGHAWHFPPLDVEAMAHQITTMCLAADRAGRARQALAYAAATFHPLTVQQDARGFWEEVGA